MSEIHLFLFCAMLFNASVFDKNCTETATNSEMRSADSPAGRRRVLVFGSECLRVHVCPFVKIRL